MSYQLSKRHEKVIAELATNGRFNNKSEVLRAAINLLEEKERELTAPEPARVDVTKGGRESRRASEDSALRTPLAAKKESRHAPSPSTPRSRETFPLVGKRKRSP